MSNQTQKIILNGLCDMIQSLYICILRVRFRFPFEEFNKQTYDILNPYTLPYIILYNTEYAFLKISNIK